MRYDVTVGIVNYNNYEKTREAIRSILEQTEELKFRIYVADNASTDDSIDKLADEFPHIGIVFSDRNLGYGTANNLILRQVDSVYHVIMNPDIILKDNALGVLYDFMQQNPDVGMCTPAIYYTNGDPQFLPKRDPKLKYLIANRLPLKSLEKERREYKMMDEDTSDIKDIEFATGCFLFVRTDLLKEIQGFDERFFMYFEDADLSRRVRERARVVYMPYVKVYHDYMRASASNPRYFFIHVASMFKYFIKWRMQRGGNIT